MNKSHHFANYIATKFNTNWYTQSDIIKALIGSISFSIFIYLYHFEIFNKALYTIFAIIGFYTIIHSNKKTLFYIGFFIGILWFYWIALSLRYYELSYLIPLGIASIALIYALIFYSIAHLPSILRFIPIISLEYIYPFDFNYLNPKLPLLYSYIDTNDYSFVAFLFTLSLLPYVAKYSYKIKLVYILVCAFLIHIPTTFIDQKMPKKPDINIELIHTNINQNDKWNTKNISQTTSENIKKIQKAIANNKDMIVFPESTFEIPLNHDYRTMNILKKHSKDITIVAGSLYITKTKKYNSTYIFTNQKVQIIHKHILTPFGERVPLPKLITNFINDIFYDGSSDFDKATSYGEFRVKGYTFRNAICFEASRDEIYKNDPKYLIATSNNAWFAQSTQHSLQNIYLKYMSKKYQTIIYHSSNKGKNIEIY